MNEHRHADYGRKRRVEDKNTDGSPWQAMKRLRVAEDRAVGVFGDVAPFIDAGGTSLPAFNLHDRTTSHDYRDASYSEQDAGQDTMSEGCELTSPSRLSPTKPSSPLASQGDDIDYHSVNHILGALHLGRRQRDEQRPQPTTSTARHSPLPPLLAAPTAPTPPPAVQWPNERSYSTPPPKPIKRRVAHLSTNSKLA